ncbi:Valine--tRNA ligase [Pseudolycoriella hygida]|uniref:Membrane protein insertase YidC n=1 Tax=Pseudolycoriella hygida TaxID=35572 RepID=A0A9Q0N799_9DIPT|nr:Valine--tRNA ligase [Pseudolycoriella hygida]
MAYGSKLLFTDVNLNLNEGEEEPSLGEITIPKRFRTGWLNQDQFRYENTSIINTVIAGKKILWQAICEKEQLLSKEVCNDADGNRLGELEQIIADNDGYIAEYIAGELLIGLGIKEEFHHQNLSVLSGGYKLRVLLAQSLFDNPDILLLDEPTNHLDIDSIYWLENYLKETFKDIDYGEIREYVGNYHKFVEQKQALMDQKLHELNYLEKKISRLQVIVDKFRAGTRAKQSKSKEKLIKKIELPDIQKSSRIGPSFRFKQKKVSGKVVLKVNNIMKNYGEKKVVNNINFVVNRGEKIVIIGPNGVGKSTLLKILVGNIIADSGNYEWGYETQISYFAQDHHELLNNSVAVFDWLQNQVSNAPMGVVRSVLGQVLFKQEEAHKNILTLSGGESARLLLAKIILEENNIMILDEPTNHLDIEAKESLKQALISYPGTLLMFYLMSAAWLEKNIKQYELPPELQNHLEFITRQFINAFSPSNFAFCNPLVVSEILKTGGQNLVQGLENLLADIKTSGEILSIKTTDKNAFILGENIAASKVYIVSWVNPNQTLADINFEDYLKLGVLEPIKYLRKLGHKNINAMGYCIGGTLLAAAAAYLKAHNLNYINSLSLIATILDFKNPGELGIFINEPSISIIEQEMDSKGYFDGRYLSNSFSLLRANDVVWSFFINNYLLGKSPMPFDLLYWNSDPTNLPSKMHSYYLRNMYLNNLLKEVNGITLLDTPIDLRKINCNSFFLAAEDDHIAPWRSVYEGVKLLNGKKAFCLTSSGHVAGIINPPLNSKYNYKTNGDLSINSELWFINSKQHQGSWWNYWLTWLQNNSETQEQRIYSWNPNEERENNFVVDTPPPTVSGQLHIGHVYSYTQVDFIVRFQRMIGKNIFYPMGFDDNGLPTERLVEKQKQVRAFNMDRQKFIDICREVVISEEEKFRCLFNQIALSVDWDLEYQTINPLSRKLSQMSFLDLIAKGEIYRNNQPILWDSVDGTALAQADIEDKERIALMNDIIFRTDNGNEIIIATTRPELLPACVAVFYHPMDQRYKHLQGHFAITPLVGNKVPILSDELVQIDKGTGLVMCCTFGDALDITWWKTHNLPLKIIIDKKGHINLPSHLPLYEQLNGLKIKEARNKTVEILREEKLLVKQAEIMQTVKCAERSGAPLEILTTPQWFVHTIKHKDILMQRARELNWYPNNMRIKLESWISSIAWDWCISRQRYFGVPFPVWYSKRAGEEGKPLFADITQLPVDPLIDLPIGYLREEVEPDYDIMDTWATSSLSPQLNSYGISEKFNVDLERHNKIFPADLRPQAHEILRTWAFYTILKAQLHENKLPWQNIMVSGWCLASDRSKMSKSKGNIIVPEELLEQYGADVVRYWTSKSKLGADSAYSEDIIKNELTDVIAIRIIVDTKEDCYKSLGIISYMYQINLEKLKDFISNPKVFEVYMTGDEYLDDYMVDFCKSAARAISKIIPSSRFAQEMGDVQNITVPSMYLKNSEDKARLIEKLKGISNVDPSEINIVVDYVQEYISSAFVNNRIPGKMHAACNQFIKELDTFSLQKSQDDASATAASSNAEETETSIIDSDAIIITLDQQRIKYCKPDLNTPASDNVEEPGEELPPVLGNIEDTVGVSLSRGAQKMKKEEWPQFAQKFANWLKSHPYVTHLQIDSNDINAEGIALLIPEMNASDIYHLDISGNQDSEIGNAVAEKIAKISKLTYLNIMDYNLTAEGAKKIAQLPNLETLFIAGNRIGDEGAKAISQMKMQRILEEPTPMQVVIQKSIMSVWETGIKKIIPNHHDPIPDIEELSVLLLNLTKNNIIRKFIVSDLSQPEQKDMREVRSQEAQQIPPEIAKALAGVKVEDDQTPGPSHQAKQLKSLEQTPRESAEEPATLMSTRIRINSDVLSGSISLKGLRFDDLILLNYKQDLSRDKIGWLSNKENLDLPGSETIWQADSDEITPTKSVNLSWINPQGVKFLVTISMDNNYLFMINQTIVNNTDESISVQYYGLINRKYNAKEKAVHILHQGPIGSIDGRLKECSFDDIKDKKSNKFPQTSLEWIGITDKYWLAALVPDQVNAYSSNFNYELKNGVEKYQVDFISPIKEVEVGKEFSLSQKLFAGAKKVDLLDQYAKQYNIKLFDRAIDFGNFGISILIVTVIIKLLMFTLASKSYRSMKKMKNLQPEIERIRTLYADDKVRLNREIMTLYKKEKVNPITGCLPLIVQIPVFFSIYKVLYVTIEMRQAPFFGWIKDLSAPDPTSIFNLFGLLSFTPPSFLIIGVWPIIMAITMFLQQKMSPEPADPVQAQGY